MNSRERGIGTFEGKNRCLDKRKTQTMKNFKSRQIVIIRERERERERKREREREKDRVKAIFR